MSFNFALNNLKNATRSALSSRFSIKQKLNISSILNYSTESNQSEEKEPPVKMDNFKSNPYFSKYEAKLKAQYNENPQMFVSTLKNRIPEKIGNGPESDVKKSKMAYSLTKKKTLDSILKTELVADLPPEEIKNIWVTYMKERSRLADVISVESHERILNRSKKFNTFLLPMPREQGYEFFLIQWSNNECHFTPLINYQARGENAPTIMTAIYFDDLVDSKKVIFEMVEIDNKNMKLEEAGFLMHQLKNYYLKAEDSDDKVNLLSCFSAKPAEFKHMDLIKQLEKDNLKLEDFKS